MSRFSQFVLHGVSAGFTWRGLFVVGALQLAFQAFPAHADDAAAINGWRSEREPIEAFATLEGFG